MARVKVAVNGFGTIGKRIADAVSLMDDMEIVGVVKRSPDYGALYALKRGYPLYAPTQTEAEKMEKAGLRVAGILEDLLRKADVVVDATPSGYGAKYKPIYESQDHLKIIYQGGEKPDVARVSFSSLCNYQAALGVRSVRVVSCNTTGLLRLICTLSRSFKIARVRAVLIRRAADPREIKKGPINSINLNPPRLPSHHALDVKTVVPDIDIVTAAVVVPTTLMHVHNVSIVFDEGGVTRDDVLRVLDEAPRIVLLSSERTGIKSTAQLIEAARDARPRNDIPELVVFEDSVSMDGGELMLFQAVHQESIVVPENVDAIRAVTGIESNAEKSIAKTDRLLGLRRRFFLYP